MLTIDLYSSPWFLRQGQVQVGLELSTLCHPPGCWILGTHHHTRHDSFGRKVAMNEDDERKNRKLINVCSLQRIFDKLKNKLQATVRKTSGARGFKRAQIISGKLQLIKI